MTIVRKHLRVNWAMAPTDAVSRSGPLVLLSLAICLLFNTATSQPSMAQDIANSKIIVHCLDEKRGHVSRVKSGNCKGRVIDAAEAERIKDARAARMRSIVSRTDTKPFPKMNRRSYGTGFFISQRGFMMTNNHVINGCNGVSVETPAGDIWKADVISSLRNYDLALLRVKEQPPAVAAFSANSYVEIEDRADLIGYPTQGIAPRLPIFTPAIRSKHYGMLGDRNLFQIKGDVRGGNSGGPVLDSSGRVIGVIFAQLNIPAASKGKEKIAEEVGHAIGNEVVFRFLARNGVQPNIAEKDASPLPREAVFAKSRDIVARITCWQ